MQRETPNVPAAGMPGTQGRGRESSTRPWLPPVMPTEVRPGGNRRVLPTGVGPLRDTLSDLLFFR